MGKARREWWAVCQAQEETWRLIKEGQEHIPFNPQEAEPPLRLAMVIFTEGTFGINCVNPPHSSGGAAEAGGFSPPADLPSGHNNSTHSC